MTAVEIGDDNVEIFKLIVYNTLYCADLILSSGFLEIKKVDILWKDRHGSSGELYLRVSMSGKTRRGTTLWNMLVDDCLPIMDMIDWSRSHPDNVHDFCTAYGIDVGWKHFLNVSTLCF